MRDRVVAIVPAAGSGKRLGMKTKKPFVLIKGVPLVVRTLRALAASDRIDAIVIACERGCVKRFEFLMRRYRLKKIGCIVVGGRTRFESVRNCLTAIGSAFDIILVHDGARPFIDRVTIGNAIRQASRHGASVVAVPESDTVKLVNRSLCVEKTLDRSRVYRAQTPQVFTYAVIKKAYAPQGGEAGVTDDASLVERLGKKVRVVTGSYRNMKITTKEDIRIAEAFL